MSITTKKTVIWGGIGAIILLMFRTRFGSQSPSNAANPGAGRGGGMSLTPVKARIITPVNLPNKIQSTGSVIAFEEVELRSEVAGRIIKIYFREGSRVGRNELLVKINDAELQAQLERAQSKIKLAESTEQRQRGLFEKSLASQNDYDIALNELNVSKADIELLKAQLAKTEIRAPFDGVIGLKYVSEGSYIVSTTRIASLQNLSNLKIDFSIPEKYSGLVSAGSELVFKVQGSDKIYKARIFAIEPKIDMATRTLQLRAVTTEIDSRVLPGAFANVELTLKDIDHALMAPTQSLIPELKGQRVFIYKGGKAVSQKVELGIRTESEVQITSGISPGDTLITTGIMQLRSGMPVNISEFE